MTNNIFKAKTGLFALIGALALASCSDKEEMPITGGDGSEISVSLKGLSASAGASDASRQEALNVFQFGSDNLFSKSVIKNYDSEAINLVKGNTRALYCVTGIEIDAAEETTEAEFALSTFTTPEGANTAPLFLSGWSAIDASQMECELTMTRGVARIDLDARDADMDITSITVEDAPQSTYVFTANKGKLDTATTVYTREYSVAPNDIESGIFMLFETDKEVHVNVHGTVDGTEITVPATLESIERNKVYTLRVYDKNASLKADFIVAEWEDGGVIAGKPDTVKRLVFDKENSVFPEGVIVDFDNNIIEVPSTGVKGMKIAFSTDLRVNLDSVYFTGERVEVDSIKQKYVKIDVEKAFNSPSGVITTLDIDIDGQLKGRPEYEIKMDLRKINMAISYDNVIIRVPESPYQIQTVDIAGSTWMAFNATSPDLGEQVFSEIGQTVEEAYQQNWAMLLGNFFQYGRQKGYSPWTSNDPNGNQATPRNIPWTDPACMPLPEGYHVATEAEWQSLLPSGVQIPSTYTAGNGEQIKVEVVELPEKLSDSPSAAANKANILMRYLRFESLETGNVLCIPICGMKTASTAEYPGGGRAMHAWGCFWISADRYTWLFQIGGTTGALTASHGRDRWNYDGFVPVRGVKNR